MRSVWNGQVAFGLVTIGVRLYAATESKNVRFRQVHEEDGGRVRYQRVCSVDGEEVPYAEIAKGYETDGGDLVMLTKDELAAAESTSSKTAEVVEFVPLESIDPIYFDKTYYLEPQKSAVKPYLLLRDVLHKSDRVAVVRITLRQRESMAVLRVTSDVLTMSTLHWADEVRTTDFPFLQEDHPQVRPKEMSMAMSLVESMAEDVFDPSEYHDDYREAVKDLVEAKIEGKDTVTPPTESGERDRRSDEDVSDLLRTLSASVDESGGNAKGSRTRSDEESSKKRPAKKAPAKKSTTKKAPAKKSAAKKATGTKKTTAKKASGSKKAAKKGA
ncbi:MAG: Ku protein [Tomitella sp.]|nr:Ku protein [Tomitella sp.]